MKYIIILFLSIISLGAAAQTSTLHGASYYNINGSNRWGVRNNADTLFKVTPVGLYHGGKVVQTTNETPTTLQTITITDETAGVLVITMVARESTTAGAVIGKKIVSYVKDGGTLTLGTPTAILADAATGTLSTATWTIAASSNNIIIQVTGVAATTVNWKAAVLHTDY